MAFPSSKGTSPNTPAKAMDGLQDEAGRIKDTATSLRDRSAAQPIASAEIRQYVDELAFSRVGMVALAATPGLTEYAKAAYGSSGLDIVAEWTAMLAQIDGTIDWIVTNFPKAASGEWLIEKRTWSGSALTAVNTMFSSASLAPLRTQLNALIATIN